MMGERLKYVPFHSFVDSGFFQQLSELKLNKFKLDVSSQQIYGYYNIKNYSQNQSPTANLSSESFGDSVEEISRTLPSNSALYTTGYITNLNTKEQFQSLDKNQFLNESGSNLYEAFKSNEVLENPSLLATFSLLSFSDLKKFKFYYWFSFPSLYTEWLVNSRKKITDSAEHSEIDKNIQNWLDNQNISAKKKSFFLLDSYNNPLPLDEMVIEDKRNDSIRVGIIDAATYETTPSWYLRNFLTLLLFYGYKSNIEVLVYRFNGTSFWLTVSASEQSLALGIKHTAPKVTGWEKNSAGALQPKFADLLSLLSPVSLAEQAVDLNLKLMKWRIIPQIQLDTIKDAKCLLLGAGTLGSYVARALLGWGVRNITFVDNGRVSFSNPVRQSLYTYEDCLDGGAPKAEAAAEALAKIFPKINAKGYNLEIPMIGHPVKDPVDEEKNFRLLEKLIEEHDVIYLLMDSRETRWLPTVLANVKGKIVLNAALGFDSFLVMRHGCLSSEITLEQDNFEQVPDQRLGCYFCNDVYAPSDSLTDRTLDQMCTVTRPGVALLASSLAVELMVSILQHPKKQFAPATPPAGSKEENKTDMNTILGELPHQIRGFLHNFSNIKLQAPNYKYCSACSLPVLAEFKAHGWQFVENALNDNKYVERLSGLTKVQEDAEKAALAFEVNDDISDAGSLDEWL